MNANKRMQFKSMRRSMATLSVVVMLGAGIALEAYTQEHPTEHPRQTPAKAEAKSNVTLEDVARYIEDYVKDKSKEGLFTVTDKIAKKKLSLKLDKVHRERLSQVGPNMFFVCADFKTADGKKVYDLDIFVQGASKDKLVVLEDKTSIHKEDGKERYTWKLNKQTGIWEQKPVIKQPDQGTGTQKSEHPEHPQ